MYSYSSTYMNIYQVHTYWYKVQVSYHVMKVMFRTLYVSHIADTCPTGTLYLV